jgi:hypothetical protein
MKWTLVSLDCAEIVEPTDGNRVQRRAVMRATMHAYSPRRFGVR